LGAVRLRRPAIPSIEARPLGRRRTPRRDRLAIQYHYDLPDAFFGLFLGPTRGYTCGYYEQPTDTVEEAQMRKFDLVCTKLDLKPGERLLDIGCGWGALMIHAAQKYGARVVGITISESQAREVGRRISAAGVSDRCEVRLSDWRETNDGPYDKIASIEMIEHIGAAGLPEFFQHARSLTTPSGLVFTQAIVQTLRRARSSKAFIPRYVFPDVELVTLSELIGAMASAQLEVSSTESLSAHYPATLRHWAANLEANRDEAIRLVGLERVRGWELYLHGCAGAFERNTMAVHQIVSGAVGTMD
jgi:cyclopropane-fatty-acyl-phospholipid synthase